MYVTVRLGPNLKTVSVQVKIPGRQATEGNEKGEKAQRYLKLMDKTGIILKINKRKGTVFGKQLFVKQQAFPFRSNQYTMKKNRTI